jgi:hypothetical protein
MFFEILLKPGLLCYIFFFLQKRPIVPKLMSHISFSHFLKHSSCNQLHGTEPFLWTYKLFSNSRNSPTLWNKRTQTIMPWVGFELTIAALERTKTIHALDRADTVIGKDIISKQKKVLLHSNCISITLEVMTFFCKFLTLTFPVANFLFLMSSYIFLIILNTLSFASNYQVWMMALYSSAMLKTIVTSYC